MKKRKWFGGLFLAAALLSLPAMAGCGKASDSGDRESSSQTSDGQTGETDGLKYKTLAELKGKTVGIMTGSVFDAMLQEVVPGAIPEYFNTFQDMAVAVAAGKIDGYMTDEPMARIVLQEMDGLGMIPENIADASYAFVLNQKNTALAEEISGQLEEFEKDGTIKAADEKWFGADEEKKVLTDVNLTGERGTLKMAVDSTSPPFTYVKNGRPTGYDIDILMQVCQRLGYGLTVENMSFSSLIPGVSSGKYDIAAACITITPERQQEVLFTRPDYYGGTVMVVKKDTGAAAEGFFPSMRTSFEKTFLRESRWKMILSGLGVTCLISVLAAAAGSVIGFLVCMVRMSKKWYVNIFSRVYVRVIQGTPLVVILMILYYLVFTGRFSMNSILVAVIGFSVNFAAYVSEMMRTGIEAVDKGQIEASQSMGYSKRQTFMKITFPQAAAHFLPVYKGEFISMVKMTSVVGYIAIQDLTKVSDIIRSRTYEAFFPLIATALIYFLLSWALAGVLGYVEKRIDPKQRKRSVKGVAVL